MDRDGLIVVLEKMGCWKFQPVSDGKYLKSNCPMAPWTHRNGTDRHPSFTVSVSETDISWATCFSCGLERGKSMPLASLVRRVDELSGGKLGKLVDEVGQRERVDLRIRLERMKYLFPWQDPARRKIEKEKGILSWDVFKPFAGRVPRYILERGIPKEICKEFQLGYDEARKRVVFPVLDEEGNFVGMQGRAVLPGIEPTWYTYPPFQKAKHVYGLNRVRGGQVILMEGVIDVLKWTAYGIKGCVSLFGSMPSEVQLSKIARMGLPVWMAWDGDEAGRKADRATVAFLKNRVPLYRIRIPEGKDPDDLTPEQARVAIAKKEMVL